MIPPMILTLLFIACAILFITFIVWMLNLFYWSVDKLAALLDKYHKN